MKLHNFFLSLLMIPTCMFACVEDCTPNTAVARDTFQSLGPIEVAGLVVSDIENAVAQWTAGTGTQFSPITTTECVVFLRDGGPTHVTLKSAFSVYSDPFLELVEACPPVGPWAQQDGPGGAPGYQGFVVKNIHQVEKSLKAAGLTKIAFSGNKFAFYEGLNGLLVKIIKTDLPCKGGVNTPPDGITDLGPVKHTDVAINQYEGLRNQFGPLLQADWTEFVFNDTAFNFSTGPQNVDVQVSVTDNKPEFQLEHITPALGVFACSPTTYNFHPAYVVPAGTLPAVDVQMRNAGFTLNSWVIIPEAGGLVLGYYVGPGNWWIEIVDARFDF